MDRGRSGWRSDRRTSRERAPASVGTGSESRGQGRPPPSGGGCYRPASHGPGPTEVSRRVPPLGVGWGLVLPTGSRLRWTACSAPRLFSVAGTVTSHHAPRTLAIKWPHSTRLETRTKESNMCASLRVKEARGRNESEGGLVPLRREPVPRGGCIVDRPILLSGRFEWERTCWDPKDGELCLNRVKPEETLVEARSDSDVQIDRQT